MKRPKFFHDLFPPEKLFFADWGEKRFVRYEGVRYANGRLDLSQWPKTVRNVKFGSGDQVAIRAAEDFELKEEVADFFEFIRTEGTGEIRCLIIRNAIPFSMEIEHRPDAKGAGNE